MALVHKDRVKTTSTTTGTGTYTLLGAVTGFQAFSVIGNANTCYYCATDGTAWEVGLGTYTTSGTTLARTTILASSNADAAVNWTAGTRTLFVVPPASKFRAIGELVLAADLPAANDTSRGGVILATQADVNTGTEPNEAVTPATLQGKFGVWTAYTPTATPASGTFTTHNTTGSKYFTVGKTTHVIIQHAIVTAGTAAGTISYSLPVNSADNVWVGTGAEIQSSGFGLACHGSTSSLLVGKATDFTTPIASGRTMKVAGTYENV